MPEFAPVVRTVRAPWGAELSCVMTVLLVQTSPGWKPAGSFASSQDWPSAALARYEGRTGNGRGCAMQQRCGLDASFSTARRGGHPSMIDDMVERLTCGQRRTALGAAFRA